MSPCLNITSEFYFFEIFSWEYFRGLQSDEVQAPPPDYHTKQGPPSLNGSSIDFRSYNIS